MNLEADSDMCEIVYLGLAESREAGGGGLVQASSVACVLCANKLPAKPDNNCGLLLGGLLEK